MVYEPTVSIVNSSNSVLAAGATFTGVAESVFQFPSVLCAVKTDQAGTLYMEFSVDGTNWDSSLSYQVAAGVNEVHRLSVTRKYFRVRFTNSSASNQTYFRLQTLFGSQSALNTPLNLSVGQDADAIMTRSINQELSIAEGKMSGYLLVLKFGRNPDVDAAEDIWGAGGDYTGFPIGVAETLGVFSSSAADTSAGTGARTVKIFGLDANYDLIDETVTLNGVTSVLTTLSFLRVYRAYCVTAGSGTTNAGNITIRHSVTTTNVMGYIAAGVGQTTYSGYTIPAGYTGYMNNYAANLLDTTANTAQMCIKLREFNGAVRLTRQFSISDSTSIDHHVYGGLSFPEKSDFIFRCTAVINANADISVTWAMILIKN